MLRYCTRYRFRSLIQGPAASKPQYHSRMQEAAAPRHWYVVYTKPREEARARENLERQGHQCYLPELSLEKRRRGKVVPVTEPLFPRYLFIRCADELATAGWGSLRSTRGVVKLVAFGAGPCTVDDAFLDALQLRATRGPAATQALFAPGEVVTIAEGPFAGLEAIFQLKEGADRAAVLLDLLGQQVRAAVPYVTLRKRS